MFPEQKPSREPIKDYPEMPVANLTPKRKSSVLVKVAIGAAILVVIVLVVWLLTQHKASPAPAKTSPTAKTSSQVSSGPSKITATTKRFDSTDLFLGFYYPSDWTVSDSGSGVLTVTSPALELKSVGNQSVKSKIVLTIQNAQTSIKQFVANTAVAPIESQKLTYKNPTPSQRAQTYLTAINYAGSNSVIDAFYITGDNGYTAGQYVPQADVVKDNPLISLNFFACGDSACGKYTSPTSITPGSWTNSDFSKPLVAMFESLVLD